MSLDKTKPEGFSSVFNKMKEESKITKVIDNYTNKEEPIGKLARVSNLNGDKTIFTSRPVIILNRHTTCLNEIKDNPDYIRYPSDREAYIRINEKYFASGGRAKNKIYSIKDYLNSVGGTFNIHRQNNNLTELLSKYLYGFEIETCVGYIDDKISNKYGFANLYDGSIEGVEYTSMPLKSSEFASLNEFMKLLKVATDFNKYCSIHIHIGNVPFSKDNAVSIYVLFQRLQEELNQLIAPYKKDFRFLSSKDKDHCKNLPKLINDDYDSLLKLFFKTTSNREIQNIISNAKYNITSRYYTVNFTNYLTKPEDQKTIEIRSLQATYNLDYIYTWLILNTAIIDYAINNHQIIMNKKIKIQIDDVISYFLKNEPDLLFTIKNNLYNIRNYIYNAYHYSNNILEKNIDNKLILQEVYIKGE